MGTRTRMITYTSTCLVLGLAAGVRGDDIIIESRAEGKNHESYSELEGNWQNSQTPPVASKSAAEGLTPAAECGTRKYLFLPEGQTTAVVSSAVARFTPRVERPGRYYVYVTWPRAANAGPVYYTVKHAAGVDEKRLMQDGAGGGGGAGNANQWVLLSDYDFMPGTDQHVELRIGPECEPVGRRLPGQVFADAVRFSSTPIEGSKAPAQSATVAAVPALAATPAVAATPVVAEAAAPGAFLKWEDQLEPALERALSERKRTLVYFSAPGSRISDCFDKVIEHDVVQRELSGRRYVLVKIDVTKNVDLASKYGVYRGGTLLLLSHSREVLNRIKDCPEPPIRFLEFLK